MQFTSLEIDFSNELSKALSGAAEFGGGQFEWLTSISKTGADGAITLALEQLRVAGPYSLYYLNKNSNLNTLDSTDPLGYRYFIFDKLNKEPRAMIDLYASNGKLLALSWGAHLENCRNAINRGLSDLKIAETAATASLGFLLLQRPLRAAVWIYNVNLAGTTKGEQQILVPYRLGMEPMLAALETPTTFNAVQKFVDAK